MKHIYRHTNSLPAALIIVALLISAVTLITPNSAEAWPTKFANCMNCHATEDSDGSIYTAIDGTDLTPATPGDPINLPAVFAGDSLQVDWYFEDATDAASGYGIGVQISVPTGWPVTAATDISPTFSNGPGWNTVWDQADGIGWSAPYDTSSYLPNSEGFTVDFDTSPWDTGTRDAAYDDASAGDLDGFADRMGADALISIPSDTPPGVYDVMVFAVGHDAGNGKAHLDQVIKVTVQTPAGLADYHTDIGSGSHGGVTVDWTTCNNPSTGSIGILKQDIGNYDCASAQQTYSGTPSELLMTWVMTTPYTANTDITGGMLYAYLENTDNKNDATVRFQLGYVQGGSFTSYGEVDQVIPSKAQETFTVDMSGISGQAPFGSYLALRHIDVTGAPNITFFGTADDPSGSIRFQVTETARYDLLTASGNTQIATADPSDDQRDVVMQRFQVDSDNGDDGQIELSSLDLVDNGTATEIQNAYVYISTTSSTTLPGGAFLLGSTGLWDGSLTNVNFDCAIPANCTVTNGTSKYIYILYDIAVSGQAGNEIQSSVQAVNVAAPDLGYGVVGSSNTLTIQGFISPETAITAPAGGITLSTSPYGITGTATQGTDTLDHIEVSTDGGTIWNNATGTSSWTYNWTLPGEDYVAHTILAKAVDINTVEDPTPASVSIFVDNVAPAGLSNVSPSNGAPFEPVNTSVVANAATDGSGTVDYFFEVAVDAGFSVGLQQSGWQPGTSYAPTLANGVQYFWHVKARDAHGNETAYTTTWNFRTVVIPPDTAITAPSGGITLSTSPYGITGTATQGTDTLDHIEVSTDGGTIWNNATGIASWTYNWTLPSEDYVAHTILAKAVDINTVEDPTPASVNIFVDNVAPAGLSNASPLNAAPSEPTNTSVVANAATDGSGSVEYFFEVAEDNLFTIGVQQSGWQPGTSYAPTLANGTQYFWHVKARDADGNETAYTGTWSFNTVAFVNPETAITAPTGGLTLTTSPFGITGTSTQGTDTLDHVEVSTDGGSIWNNATGTTSWTYNWTLPSEDYVAHTILTKAVDINTVEDPTPASVGIFVDNVAPAGLGNASPGNGLGNQPLNTTVVGNTATDGSGTVEYFFEVAEDNIFTVGLQQSGWQGGTSFAPTLANGTQYFWHVKARDADGNETAYTGTWNFTTISFVNPETAITAPTGGLTLTTSPYGITGTSTQGTDTLDHVEVSTDGGTIWNNATGTASWTYNWTLPSEDYVAHTILAKAVDINTVEDPTPATVNIFVDNVAPAGLSNASPVNAAPSEPVNTSVVANAATDGSGTVQYFFQVAEDSGFTVALQQSAWQAGTSYAPTLANNTQYFWHVKARDADGNETTYTTTWNFTTESATPPETTITAPTGGITLTTSPYGITGTATQGTDTLDHVEVSTDGGSIWNNATGTTSWTYNWTLPSEDYVAHTILAKAVDINTVEDPTPSSVSIFVDNVAPAGLSNSSPANAAPSEPVNTSVVANAATDGSGTVDYFFEVAEDAGFTVGVQQSGWLAGTSYAPTLINNTQYFWHVKARDADGNETAYTATWNFTTIAFVNPDTSITTPTGGLTLSTSPYGITGTATQGTDTLDHVEVSTDGGTIWNNATGTTNWTYNWTLPSEDYVAHTILAKAVDINTVEDPTPASVSIFVDNVAPAGLSNSSPANAAPSEPVNTSVVANAATDGSGTVQYFFQVAEDAGFSTGLQQSAWQAGTSYAPTLAFGTQYFWHVKARDADGNETAYTGTWNFTTGAASPPETSITTPTGGLTLSTSPYGITGTATQGTDTLDHVEVSTDGGSIWNNATGTTAWTYNWTLPSEDYVAHTILAKAVDINTIEDPTPASVNIFVDNVAPAGLSNLSPLNAAPSEPVNTSVVANTATDGSGTVQYFFQVAEDAGFSIGLQQSAWQAGTSYAPTLAFGTQYFWHVKARDADGNETAYTGTWIFTTGAASPPETTITNPSGGITLSTSPYGITGTATQGTDTLDHVEVSTDGGSIWNNATGTASWTYNWTLPSEDYVAHTILAKAVDINTIEDPTPASVNIFVDNVAPAGLSNLSPLNTAPSEPVNTSVVANAATDGSGTVQYFFQVAEDAGFSIGLQQSAWQAGTSYAPTLAFGTQYFWHVKARDADGNETAYTGTWNFTTGAASPPETSITTPTGGLTLSTSPYGITGTATQGTDTLDHVEVSTDGGSIWNNATGTTAWTYNWTLPSEDYVAHTILAKAVDINTIEDPTPASVSIFVDNVAPAGLSNLSPLNAAPSEPVNTSVVANAATDGSGTVQYFFQVAEDAGFSIGLQQSGWQGGTSYAPTLAFGTQYFWHVKARDADGNETAYTGTWNFTTNSFLNPETAITAPSGGITLSTSPYGITGTATQGTDTLDHVEVSTDGGSIWNNATGTASWTYNWTLPSEDYVAHTILAKAVDINTIEDPTPASVSIFVDNVAPAGLSNLSPLNAAPSEPVNTSVVANVATDGSGSIEYFFELAENTGFSVGLQQSGWQAGTSYAPTLAFGTIYYWHVKARDAAGNETAFTGTWNFTTNSFVNPETSITAPSGGITLSNSPYGITGTATQGTDTLDHVEVSTDGGSIWNNATGTTNWTYNWTLPSEDYVAHTILARAVDINTVDDPTPASVNIFVDNVAPAGLSNLSPLNAAPSEPFNTSVVANVATDGSGTVQYFFEVAEDAGFSAGLQQSGWQAGTSYAPTLAFGTQYFWHVKARDATGNETTYTATWNFTTNSFVNPETTITAPSGGITLSTSPYGITGTATQGTDTLDHVEVSTDGGTIWNNATGTTSWTYNWTLPSEDYVAHTILAKSVDINTVEDPTPASVSIFVDNVAPAGLSNSSPLNAAPSEPVNTSVVANVATDGSGTVQYFFQVAENAGFTVGLQQSAWQAGTSYAPTLAFGTQYFWHVKARDADGNETAYTGTWNLTTNSFVNPETAITAPSGGITLSTSPYGITGTAAQGTDTLDHVEVSTDGGTIWNNATGTTNWTFNWTLPSEDYVAHTILAKAVDINTVEDPTPASVNIFVDNVAPAGLSNSSPLNAAPSEPINTSVAASAATDGSGTVQYFFEVAEDAGFSVGLQQSGWQAGMSYAPTLAFGTQYFWHVKARDASGNETTYTATWNFNTNAFVNPETAITAPSGGITLSTSPYGITGTASQGTDTLDHVEVSTDGGTIWNNATGTTNWTFNWTLPGEDYVAHTILAKAVDINTVEDPTPASVSIFVDNVAPAGLSNSSPLNAAPSEPVNTSVVANVATDGSGTVNYFFEVAENSSFTVGIQQSGWQAGTSFAATLTYNTQYFWHVKARDADGNETAYTATWNFTTEGFVNPGTAITTPTGGLTLTTSPYGITGTATQGTDTLDHVEVSTDGGTIWNNATGTTSWAYNWTLPSEDYVAHTILARAVDINTVEDPTPASVSIFVDNVAPAGLSNASPLNSAPAEPVLSIVAANTATDGSGTVQYFFQVAEDVTFTTGLQQSGWQAGTSYAPTLTFGTQYFWHVKARDADSNETGYTATWNFTTTAFVNPETAITAPTINQTLTSSPSAITGTAIQGTDTLDHVEVSTDGGTIWNNATGATNWTYNWTLPSEDYVAHTILAKAVDINLVEDATPASVNIYVDNVAPAGLTNASPSIGAPTVSVSASVVANAATDGSGTIQYFFEVAEDATFTTGLQQSVWLAGNNFSPTLTYNTQYFWHVKARDTAGNETGYTAAWNFTTEPFINPDTAISTPTGGVTLSNTPYAITGTAIQGTDILDHVEVSTDGGTIWNNATGTTNWTYNWTLPSEDYVAHTILARAVDTNTIEDPTPVSVNIFADTVAPAGLSNASPSNASPSEPVNTLVVANAATDGSGSVEYFFEVAEDAGFTIGIQQSGWQPGMNYAPALLFETTYYWHVKARDVSGNETAYTSPEWSFTTVTSDSIPPASTITGPGDGAVLNSSSANPYIISGSASDNLAVSGIEVSTNGGSNWFTASCTGCPGANVTWTYSWALPADGMYTILSRSTDTSVNLETPSAGNQVLIDRTAPAHIWSAPADNSFFRDGDSINVSAFISENGVGVADGANCNATIDGSISSFSGVISYSSGTQLCSGLLTINADSGLLDGQHNLNLNVIDLAGNSALSPDRFINIDNTAPSSSVIDPADGASFNSTTPDPYTISGTATDNITISAVEVSTNGGLNWAPALCTNCPGANVNWIYSWSLPLDGSYVVMSRATDSLNNVEVPVSGNTVSVLRTPLTIINTVPADGSTNVNPDNPITILWSKDVDCSTVNTTFITINPGSFTVSDCSANQAILTPSGQTFSTSYLVVVTAGVTDLSGNPMVLPTGFSYTTSLPEVPSLSYMSYPYDNGLSPDFGNTTTEFTFRVMYIDNQDDPPAANYPMIFIGDNDSYYGYTMIESDPLDTLYSDGKIYSFTTGFGPAEDIRYFFEAQAATGDLTIVNLPTVSPGYESGPDVRLLPGYNVVGVPKDLSLSNLTYTSLLGDDSGYRYCISWNSFGPDHPVNGIQGDWIEMTHNNLSSGKGYFIYSDGGQRKLDEPAGLGNDDRASVDIPLNGGWTIISNPYNAFIKLRDVFIVRGATEYTYSDAVINGWVSNSIYEYEGDGPGYSFKAFNGSPEATLDPWMGYYIYVSDNTATSLRIYKP